MKSWEGVWFGAKEVTSLDDLFRLDNLFQFLPSTGGLDPATLHDYDKG